ncbi:DNA cytosine methyltransferase [Streptococcus suis]|uniref:DNA cytosine methyltransferase n=1 Tax=Streptococcus suis TaxID=1307 RepID=UPI001EE95664|nr:DNA cytosine methyltransferase [Streptococcus suis]MBS8100653.1 DNA cytosine methyltransferase [Streptococcus suis]
MKFLDLFAGIGGFRLGMERAGHECVGFCEIDPFARKSYKAIHDTEGEFEFHDITAVTDESVRGIGSVDVICGGFPCQAFSIAGKRAGFEDTRGTLFFEIARFASILRPKYLFLENVTGLLSHDNGNTFETILGALAELGYDAEWQVFNSKNFGVPQNRERVFIIGHLRGSGGRAIFPFGGGDEEVNFDKPRRVGNINPSGNGMNGEVFSSDGLAPTLTTNKGEGIKIIGVMHPNFNQSGCVYDPNGIAPTIRTMQGGGLEPKIAIKEVTTKGYSEATVGGSVNLSHPNSITRRGRVGKQVANTLLTGEEQGVVAPNFRIRKLTPRECWRLQGFPDWAFDRAQAVNSNSQLYKQAGNSVTVNVIEAIAKRLEETDE